MNIVVLVYDHRGVASSKFTFGMQEITVHIMAEDMLDLIDHLGWTEADILGFSMGGDLIRKHNLLLQNRSLVIFYSRCRSPTNTLRGEILYTSQNPTYHTRRNLRRCYKLGPRRIGRVFQVDGSSGLI